MGGAGKACRHSRRASQAEVLFGLVCFRGRSERVRIQRYVQMNFAAGWCIPAAEQLATVVPAYVGNKLVTAIIR